MLQLWCLLPLWSIPHLIREPKLPLIVNKSIFRFVSFVVDVKVPIVVDVLFDKLPL
jgi:hypothetical protein